MTIDDLHAMPNNSEVSTITAENHAVHLVEITDENREYLARTALSMYANEPCRICGEPVTFDCLYDGAVWAGVSVDKTTSVAHKLCWQHSPMIDGAVPVDWIHQ